MFRFSSALALALLFGIPANAESFYITGNELYAACQKQDDIASKNLVLGYTVGVFDLDQGISKGTPIGGSNKEQKTTAICIPAGVPSDQLRASVCRFLASNPKERHWMGGLVVYTALANQWPCK